MDPAPEMKTVQHKTTMVLLECKLYETLHPEAWDWQEICMKSGIVIKPSESIKVVPPRHNGTELGHHLQSLEVTIPQEVKPLDDGAKGYAAGWNDCLRHVKVTLAGITVNQQMGAMGVRSWDFAKTASSCEKSDGVPALTQEERDAVAGIALVLERLKLYPEQVGRTKQDDLDLLWRIAGEKVKP